MPAFAVVKHLDLIEYIVACLIPAAIYLALDPLEFEQLEETLGNCIVMAVTSAAHAADQVVGLQKALPMRAAELAALVGVDHHFLLRLVAPHRHQQHVDNQNTDRTRLD